MICAFTSFLEAIPLSSITAQKITMALIHVFTPFDLSREIRSDQGSYLIPGLFQQVIYRFGSKQFKSRDYYPQSQRALEQFQLTLNNAIRTYYFDNEKD